MQKAGLQLLLVLTVLLLLSSSIFSQQRNHEKVKYVVTASDLDRMAKETDFNGNMVSEIHRDNRNTYYAIRTSIIDSKYATLRILEQVYSDREIVHIGKSVNLDYELFLVNNKLVGNSRDVQEKLNKFHRIATQEERSMTTDQVDDWITTNDKTENNE
jgi:hypothetical protein